MLILFFWVFIQRLSMKIDSRLYFCKIISAQQKLVPQHLITNNTANPPKLINQIIHLNLMINWYNWIDKNTCQRLNKVIIWFNSVSGTSFYKSISVPQEAPPASGEITTSRNWELGDFQRNREPKNDKLQLVPNIELETQRDVL